MSTTKNKSHNLHKHFMKLAYIQAYRALGKTGTNPPVGCIITNDKNEIVSFGQTALNGRPHAESVAIKNLKKIKKCTLYATLEPCNHFGLTPPCTNLIIKKKIKRVFYSVNDIDVRTKGKTKKILQEKKIIVKDGIFGKEIKNFYKFYYKNRIKKLPFITCKLAISKDGFIKNLNSKNITNSYSRKISHYFRIQNDGILISVKTLIKDNSMLDCRIDGLGHLSPTKIILDKNLDIPLNSKIINKKSKKKILIFYNKKKNKKMIKLKKYKNIKLIFSNIDKNKNFLLNDIFKKLYNLNFYRILIEGGKTLTESLFNQSLVDQFYLFKSNKKIGTNGRLNCNTLLKKINNKCISKRYLTINLNEDKILYYKF